MTYLVEWKLHRATSGTFEVETLEAIPAGVLSVVLYLQDERGYDPADDLLRASEYDDMECSSLSVVAVYEVEPVQFDSTALLIQALPLIEASVKAEEARRRQQREAQERQQLEILQRRYGSPA